MKVPEPVQYAIREAERLGRAGDLPGAITLYRQALARYAQLPDSWYNLGLLQRRARQFDAALASYQEALRWGVRHPEEVHLNRAVIYTDDLRDDAAAERELLQALRINPTYLPGLQNLANLQTDLGRRDSARRTYERILSLEPAAFEALARYAQLFEVSTTYDPIVTRLRAALVHPAATWADRASLGFALARGLDQAGEYRQAFVAATAANQASRASATSPPYYDRRAQERLIDGLIAAFPRLPRNGSRTMPIHGPRPIFICGMFRSGSTLVEQLLGGHRGVATGGELDLLGHRVITQLAPFPASMDKASQSTLGRLATDYLANLARLHPNSEWVTDKRLDNFLYIGLIRALFPEARIIHTSRAALDMCLSIYFLHLDHSFSYALDLMDIGHYYLQYRRLMHHWQAIGADVFELNYDELVREPGSTLRALFGYSGLTWDEEYLNFAERPGSVKTASVWQVREPLYQRSSGRAVRYLAELAPLALFLGRP